MYHIGRDYQQIRNHRRAVISGRRRANAAHSVAILSVSLAVETIIPTFCINSYSHQLSFLKPFIQIDQFSRIFMSCKEPKGNYDI